MAYKGLIFTDGAGRKCIHGTDPTHPYTVEFVNEKGVVGVKRPDEFGGEPPNTRIRCITWDVLTGELESDDYEELLDQGWEKKPGDTHTSVLVGSRDVCECCGQVLEDSDDDEAALDERIQEAIDFLAD